MMAVVKANAYGHGIEQVASAFAKEGVCYFGVAHVYEARQLAQLNQDVPIYLLSPTMPQERAEVIQAGWTACLSSFEEIEDFERIAQAKHKQATVHLALDTGMGRGGFLPQDLLKAFHQVETSAAFKLEGIGSHLPSADEDPVYTQAQFEQFDTLVESLPRRLQYIHLANSAGLLDYSSRTTNLVRPGLMLYGVSPLPQYQSLLHTTMRLKSVISLIRQVPAGHSISYGRSFTTQEDSQIATVGIGYGDGLPRALSGENLQIDYRGHMIPVIGRITMDQIMCLIPPHLTAQAGDHVEIFGTATSITEIAALSKTIPWEIFTGITPRVLRSYKDEQTLLQ